MIIHLISGTMYHSFPLCFMWLHYRSLLKIQGFVQKGIVFNESGNKTVIAWQQQTHNTYIKIGSRTEIRGELISSTCYNRRYNRYLLESLEQNIGFFSIHYSKIHTERYSAKILSIYLSTYLNYVWSSHDSNGALNFKLHSENENWRLIQCLSLTKCISFLHSLFKNLV